LLVVNTSLALAASTRTDIEVVLVPATESADELGAIQAANMIMLGAYLARRPIVSPKTVVKVLRRILPKRRQHLIGINEHALERGAEIAGQASAAEAS